MGSHLVRWLLAGVLMVSSSYLLAAEKIVVFAAASMNQALSEIITEYEKQHPEKVVASFAASSKLARQITEGAPADLFISADLRWMEYVAERGKIASPELRGILATNELVVIANKKNPISSLTLGDASAWQTLLAGGRLAVGDPDHVPAGIYAKEALSTLNLWSELMPQLARASNVRAALTLVERDEAPAGIVYSSDVTVSDKVKIVARFPASSHTPIEYPVAVIASQVGQEPSQAVKEFFTYLRGSEAAHILQRYGFRQWL